MTRSAAAPAKIDFKTQDKALYRPPVGSFVRIDVPPMSFVMVDGQGDPNQAPAYRDAVEWLYSVSYALKFAMKAEGRDYVVPPLEGLWWADDPSSFVAQRKHAWRWTMMIRTPLDVGVPVGPCWVDCLKLAANQTLTHARRERTIIGPASRFAAIVVHSWRQPKFVTCVSMKSPPASGWTIS